MIIFKRVKDLHHYLNHHLGKALKTGFVPTMGALHQGHVSLIDKSLQTADVTICSIFVNPTQFNDPKDFEKYPVTIEPDVRLLENTGCDILFLPAVDEIYPVKTYTKKTYDLGYLETVLEGAYRPGHFQGVCEVMDQLLEIVMPDHLFMGQKDYQQCMVVSRLLTLTGKESHISFHINPTRREPNGLAMSSRNKRISDENLIHAPGIFQTLSFIKENYQRADFGELKLASLDLLRKKQFRPDYVEIANADTLELIDNWDGRQRLVALVAAFLGEVRLIDNMILNEVAHA